MNDEDFHDGGRGDAAPDAQGFSGAGAPGGIARGDHALRAFIAAQCMLAVGSIDADGAVWASLLFGKPGFVRSGDGAALRLEMPLKEGDLADPAWGCRLGGAVQRLDRRGTEIAVRDAGPRRPGDGAGRLLRCLGEPRLPVQTAHGAQVRGAVERIVRRADTLFVAGRHAVHGLAVAHRGGDPGFVVPASPTTLRLPIEPGNDWCANGLGTPMRARAQRRTTGAVRR